MLGHGTYKGNSTMNFITQYGLRGLELVVRIRVRAHFILQNLVLPYMCLKPSYVGPKMLTFFHATITRHHTLTPQKLRIIATKRDQPYYHVIG